MTVQDLIAKLKALPQDSIVLVDGYEGGFSEPMVREVLVYRDHPAFIETIETSIYLSPVATGKGLGTLLYEQLFTILKNEKVHLAVVGIALPNEASIRLHRKVGFEEVGVFREYAKVNGKYFSSIWMQKRLDL